MEPGQRAARDRDKEKWEEKKREQEAKKVGLAKEAKAAVDPIVEKTSPDERHPFEGSKDTKGPTTDFPKNFNQDAHDSWNGRNRNMDDPFNDK